MTRQPTTVVNIARGEQADVYIGRAGRGRTAGECPWGNPFVIGRDGTRDEVIAKYAAWIQTQPQLLARLPELQGQRLGCFCHPAPCHGNVLARLADALPDPPPVRTTLRLTFAAGSADSAGGSVGVFALESATRAQPYVVRRDYPGAATPAQVAYQTLITALEYILTVLARTGRQPADWALEIAGAPPVVIGQLTGSTGVAPADLWWLHARCRTLLGQFGRYQLTQADPSALTALPPC